MDIYIKCRGKINTKNKEKLTNIHPKYTRGGLKNGGIGYIGIGKGWSFEGIYRFNQLFAFVRDDREEHPNFAKDWIAKKKEAMISSSSRRSTKIPPEGFAQWTLSANESLGSRDAVNKNKLEQISVYYKQRFASISGSAKITQDVSDGENEAQKRKGTQVNKSIIWIQLI